MPFYVIETNENNVTAVSFSEVSGSLLMQGGMPGLL